MYCPKSEQLVRLRRAKFHDLQLCDDFFWWVRMSLLINFAEWREKFALFGKSICRFCPKFSEKCVAVSRLNRRKWRETLTKIEKIGRQSSIVFILERVLWRNFETFFRSNRHLKWIFLRMFGRLTSKNRNETEENCTSNRPFFRFICRMNSEFDTEIDRIVGECYSKT